MFLRLFLVLCCFFCKEGLFADDSVNPIAIENQLSLFKESLKKMESDSKKMFWNFADPLSQKVSPIPFVKEHDDIFQQNTSVASFYKKIFIQDIEVRGVLFFDYQKILDIILPNENRNLTFSEISDIVKSISKLYRSEGYLTSYAFLPEQEIKNGVLRINVVEGVLDRIIVLGKNAHFHKKFIEKVVKKFLDKSLFLNENALKAAVTFLNKNPIRKVFFYLNKGRDIGKTDLLVRVLEQDKSALSFQCSSTGTHLSGRERYSLDCDFSHLFGGDSWGHASLIYADSIWGCAFMQKYLLYWVPIEVSFYSNYSRFNKSREHFSVRGNSFTHIVSFESSLRKRNHSHILNRSGLKIVKSRILADLNAKSSDDLTVLFSEFEYINFWKHWSTQFSLKGEWGIANFLGSSKKQALHLSNIHASPEFSKGVFLSKISFQKHARSPEFFFKFVGQCSTKELLSSEQLSLTGFNAVRGFEDGDFRCTNGAHMSLEMNKNIIFRRKVKKKKPNPQKTSLVQEGVLDQNFCSFRLFTDYGFGSTEPDSKKKITKDFASVGTALTFHFFKGTIFSSQIGIPLENSRPNFKDFRFYFLFRTKVL